MAIETLKQRLQECTNLKQVFNVIEQEYKIEECKLGVASKPAVINGILTAIKMLQPKQRAQ